MTTTAWIRMFKSLLRHHWMEEAQHAKLDTLIVEAIAARLTPAEIVGGVEGYLADRRPRSTPAC